MANLVDPPIAPPMGDEDPVYRSLVREWRTGLVGWLRGYTNVGVQAYVSSNQSVSATTETVIDYDTEVYDYGSNFNTSTSVFTAPEDGRYLVIATALFGIGADGQSYHMRLYVNSTLTALSQRRASGTFAQTNQVMGIIDVDANDTIDVRAYTSGADTITSGINQSSLYIARQF